MRQIKSVFARLTCPHCRRPASVNPSSIRKFSQANQIQAAVEETAASNNSTTLENNKGKVAGNENKMPIVKNHKPRQEFREWMATQSSKYRNAPEEGPLYLGGESQPFPLNPQFRPRRPLSEVQKNKIFDQWKKTSSSQLGTICAKYGISLKRLEAVVRLKLFEADFKKSHSLENALSKGVEAMTGASASDREMGPRPIEPLVDIAVPATKQVFSPIAETDDFSPDLASRYLGLDKDLETTYQLKLEHEMNRRALQRHLPNAKGAAESSTAAKLSKQKLSAAAKKTKKNESTIALKEERYEWVIRDVKLSTPSNRRAPSLRTKIPKAPVEVEERKRIILHKDGKRSTFDIESISRIRM